MDMMQLAVISQIIFLECVLSIDNAAVMGAMVAHLPNDQPIPWPRQLARFGASTNRFWGGQQDAALRIGLFGAYAGRVLMLFAATLIMRYEWVQIIGALYLIYLCVAHFAELHAEQRSEGQAIRAGAGFWMVVLSLNLADMAFSLDNVVAALALSDKLWVIIMGVSVGIVVVRFAASIFTRMIAWEPALNHTAYLLVFAIGLELLLDVGLGIHTEDGFRFAISTGLMAGSVLVARTRALRPILILTRPLLRVAALGNAAVLLFVRLLGASVRLLTRR
jgi:tellurite resistance protein TerC